MKRSLENVINVLAERVADRTDDQRRDQLQRRNQVVDIYGAEFQSYGDRGSPANFYISVSPDMTYIERFEFKVTIQPFAMPVGNNAGTSLTSVNIDPQELDITNQLVRNTAGDITAVDSTIVPNPHTHTNLPHNHSLSAGVSLFTSSVQNFRILVEGIDITNELQLQYPNGWITGEGTFPEVGLKNFDLIDVAGMLPDWQRGILMQAGYKNVQMYSDGFFSVKIHLYLKYGHTNR